MLEDCLGDDIQNFSLNGFVLLQGSLVSFL